MSESQPDLAEVVEANRETIELVADGDDDSARMARNILAEAEDGNG
jgi:DNA-binding XRE family transcriptional regulator